MDTDTRLKNSICNLDNDETLVINTLTDYKNMNFSSEKRNVYIDLGTYKIGPIKPSNLKVIDGKLFCGAPQNTSKNRLKGKLRKHAKTQTFDPDAKISDKDCLILDYIKIGPISELKMDRNISYLGQVENGVPHGIGIYTTDKEIYQGPFVNGKKNGRGFLILRDRAKYSGEFLNNKRHGVGTLVYTCKDSPVAEFNGTWIEDRFEGPNCYIEYASGAFYTGSVVNFIRDGFGTYYSSGGTLYECNWKFDKRYGPGIMTFVDGTRVRCIWVDNEGKFPLYITFPTHEIFIGNMYSYDPFVGYGSFTFTTGIKFEGRIYSIRPFNGKGAMYFPCGSIYFGHIVDSKRQGWGAYLNRSDDKYDLDRYVGMWKNDQRNGWGTYYCSYRSCVIHTYWTNDKYSNPSIGAHTQKSYTSSFWADDYSFSVNTHGRIRPNPSNSRTNSKIRNSQCDFTRDRSLGSSEMSYGIPFCYYD